MRHKGAHFPNPTQRPLPSGLQGPSQDPSGSLLVVEDDVGDPDHLRRDSEGCDVAELGGVPAQLVVTPLLCVGRGVQSPGAAWGGGLGANPVALPRV